MTGEPTILVNGQPRDSLPVLDRGLMYGDGVFRTLRLRNGQAVWWQDHLHKLAADCARLGMACPEPALWAADRDRLAASVRDGVLKLLVTRGTGARGYKPPVGEAPTRIALAGPLPAYPEEAAGRGARVRVCELRLSRQPRLAGIKHLNRLENVLARAEWDDPDIHEGLLLDADGWVVSGVSSNLFIYRGGELHTPPIVQAGVSGVARARLIDAARGHGLPVRELDLRLEDVHAADEVLLSNSLIGVWRVFRLGERTWPVPAIHPAVREYLNG